MKIAIIGNVSLQGIEEKLQDRGHDVYSGYGFDTWIQELLIPDSALYSFAPKLIFIVVDGGSLFQAFSKDPELLGSFKETIEIVKSSCKSHPECTFVVSSLDIPLQEIKALNAVRQEVACASLWRNSFCEEGIPVLDLSELIALIGREKAYNNKGWYLGGLRFSLKAEALIAEEIVKVSEAILGKRKKVLVLDLDNTLWGGVIGEDGIEGIQLSRHGQGARFYDFQKRVKEIKDLGILLAIVSKNNYEDAINAICNHTEMILREEDFISLKINWAPKAQNIIELIEELNVGTDSVVFIDDNPVEREAVKTFLPEVVVPDFPEDTSSLEAFARNLAKSFFLPSKVTEEDLKKTEQYQIEAQRVKLKRTYANVDDYLRSLGMVLEFLPVTEADIPRVAQLTQKTNQFNLTTRRYLESDILAMLDSNDTKIFLGKLRDKFGDYGKTILSIVRLLEGRAVVDTFLMSCRIMGRGVEDAALNLIEKELYVLGVREITGEYLKTAKNTPVVDFWRQMGYDRLESSAEHAIYRKSLDGETSRNNHIEVVRFDQNKQR